MNEEISREVCEHGTPVELICEKCWAGRLDHKYPPSQHFLEMLLVGMLGERRSWSDIEAIGHALWQIRQQAESLRAETRQFAEKV